MCRFSKKVVTLKTLYIIDYAINYTINFFLVNSVNKNNQY